MPAEWRNKDLSEVVLSFDVPLVEDGSTMVFLQFESQIPAFGRYLSPLSTEERETTALDNEMGDPRLWAPQTRSHWDPCKKTENTSTV